MLVLLVFLLDKLRHTPCPPAKKFEKLDEGGNQFSWCLFVFGARAPHPPHAKLEPLIPTNPPAVGANRH